MATTTVEDAAAAPEQVGVVSYLDSPRTISSWLLTRDHKRIGVMYLSGVVFAFMTATVLALILGAELLTSKMDLLTATGIDLTSEAAAALGRDLYARLFSLHGSLMVFVFLVPAIPAALGNFFLPLMLGAKNVAFPRLNLAGFYLWLIGTLIFVYGAIVGQIDMGWTLYTPLSTQGSGALMIANIGVMVLSVSSILTGLNFVVTIHKLRAPGMTWNRLPLFAWSLYASAIIQLLATPVLILTMGLLIAESALQIGVFDPLMGGDPLLYQHFFWFYGHPALYVMVLPALGLIAEVISTHSKKHIFGYKAVALSFIAIALLSFLGWGQHLFVSGQANFTSVLFSLFAFAASLPIAVSLFSFVATLRGGAISLTAPMLYALIFLFTFTLGWLAGLFLDTLSTGAHLQGSSFETAQFHYMTMGGAVVALIAGLHHWFPKIFGRMYSEAHARIGAALLFVGLNLSFFPRLIAGSQGLSSRYAEYPDQFAGYQLASSLGTFILVAAVLWILTYLSNALRAGEPAPANPWGGASLEWATQSPPITDNFHQTPHVDAGPYNFPEIDPSALHRGHH